MHLRKSALLLVCLGISMISWAQQRNITGTVTDPDKKPLIGASVIVKGSSRIGTTTNANGDFALSVPTTARTLVISFAGMVTREVSIGSGTKLTISLQTEEKSLEEVVVVGYGTQKKKQVTSAIGKVDPEPIASLVSPSLDKQLGGRTAGLQVTNPSGLVNQAPRIRIRGVNSISGGRGPLIVLDGVPTFDGGFSGVANTNSLTDINPADVESIEVLKDGAATAIFGSRAANGVLLITTKKGKSGRSNVHYSVLMGFSKPYKRFELLNAEQFVTIANEKFRSAGIPDQAFLNSEKTSTDWQEYIFRPSSTAMTHNLSIDGGNDKSNYFLSFNITDQQGMIITNKVKRYAIRANLEHKINQWIKISNNITLSRTDDNDQNNGGNALSGAITNSLRSLPNVRVFDPTKTQFDGYNVTSDGAALGQDANLRSIENNFTNIAFVLNNNKFRSVKNRVINNATLEIKPLNWLTWNTKVAIDYQNGVDFQGLDPRHGDGRGVSGSVFNQSLNNIRWVFQNFVNATKNFKNHGVTITLGTESQNEQFNSFSAQGRGISDIFFLQQNVVGGSFTTQLAGGGYNEGPGFVSYFGRLNYEYKNKYFLQASFRRDGLSRFAPDKRFGNFPGVSVGWRPSEEVFWKDLGLTKIVNEIKIRGSWAKVGNDQIVGGLFPYLSQYGSAPYGATNGIAISLLGNPGLEWETNQKFDIGADISLLNKINITFDWFKNRNNGLVLAAPLPVSFGLPGNRIFRNIGDMENKGFELSVNADIIKRKDFELNLGFNYTSLRNKVLNLYQNQDVIDGLNILRVGEPISGLFGFRYAGVNSGNGNPMYYKADGTLIQGNIANTTYYTLVKPGDPALGTQTTLAVGDRTILGNVLPTWFGGITGDMRYKAFSLNMLWRYSGGNVIANLTKQDVLMNQSFQNNGVEILKRWTKPGDNTDVPRLWQGRDNFTNLQGLANSRFIEKGDFIRLDNLQINYTMPKELVSKIGNGHIKSFKFFVQGQNLLILTSYSGIDPDNTNELGHDNNAVPPARIVSVGINVGF